MRRSRRCRADLWISGVWSHARYCRLRPSRRSIAGSKRWLISGCFNGRLTHPLESCMQRLRGPQRYLRGRFHGLWPMGLRTGLGGCAIHGSQRFATGVPSDRGADEVAGGLSQHGRRGGNGFVGCGICRDGRGWRGERRGPGKVSVANSFAVLAAMRSRLNCLERRIVLRWAPLIGSNARCLRGRHAHGAVRYGLDSG